MGGRTCEELDDLKSHSPELQAFRDTLKQEVKRRVEMTNTILVASAFHPSFNRLWFVIDPDRFEVIKNIVKDAYDALVPSIRPRFSKQKTTWNIHRQILHRGFKSS